MSRLMYRCAVTYCCVIAFSSFSAYSYAATLFVDRTNFEAALSAPTVDTFDDVAADIVLSTTPTARPGYSLSVTPFTSSIGTVSISLPPNGYLTSSTAIAGHLHQQNALIFEFSSPVAGLGFDYGGFDATLEMQVGDSNETVPFTGSYPNGFFGFVSDTPFTTARILNVSGANSDFDLDNVTFSSVPEPGTLLMLLLGLAAMGGTRLRR